MRVLILALLLTGCAQTYKRTDAPAQAPWGMNELCSSTDEARAEERDLWCHGEKSGGLPDVILP